MGIEHGGTPTLADLTPRRKQVTDEFLTGLNQVIGQLPDEIRLFDLLPRKLPYTRLYQRQVNPPAGWEEYRNSLPAFGGRPILSFTINKAIKAGYTSLGDIRETSYREMIDPPVDSLHQPLGRVSATILKRGFEKEVKKNRM